MSNTMPKKTEWVVPHQICLDYEKEGETKMLVFIDRKRQTYKNYKASMWFKTGKRKYEPRYYNIQSQSFNAIYKEYLRLKKFYARVFKLIEMVEGDTDPATHKMCNIAFDKAREALYKKDLNNPQVTEMSRKYVIASWVWGGEFKGSVSDMW